jgi:hypothetical protein
MVVHKEKNAAREGQREHEKGEFTAGWR